MNKQKILVFVIFAFAQARAVAQTEWQMPLDLNWNFFYNKIWYETSVPNSVHTDLLKHKLIEDPFYGDNENKLQWVDSLDWTYRKDFVVDEKTLNTQNIELRFNGLDTYADVFLNDSLILRANNMFRTWKVPCKKILRKGSNRLEIVFRSATKKSSELYESYKPANLPGGERVMSRKAQYHFGWDFAPRFVTCGIWKNIELTGWDNLKLESVLIETYSIKSNQAYLFAKTEIYSGTKSSVLIIITDKQSGKDISFHQLSIDTGRNYLSVPFKIDDPVLWWCNGSGNPHMYRFALSVTETKGNKANREINFGLRTIEVVQQPDSAGKSFFIRLNNKPVFMKGANYIPQDVFLNRVTPAHYDSLLLAVKNANMNMLRVWGGGIYENDLFYDLCDKYGILVWQDFMFACGMYPFDDALLQNVKTEAEQQVKRLANHPCLALWCGNNENSEGWQRWGWQKEYSEKEREQIWSGYQKIFNDILPAAVNKYSKTFYWETSPQFGRGDGRHTKEGDAHNWFVWHDGEPFENYETKVPRFMSEFGFQSLPDLETIKMFCPDEGLNLNSAALKSHQKHSRGFAIINSYMQKYFGKVPSALDEYIALSQQLQSGGMSTGIIAHLNAAPYCMGSLIWQLNDCWPGISWSMIDYYGRKKKLYYDAMKVFEQK